MLFNSYVFILLYLPIVVTIYHWIRSKSKYEYALVFILLSSLVFYAFDKVSFLPVLLISICGNWVLSQVIKSTRVTPRVKKWLLRVGILANLTSIFYFKYFIFTLNNLNLYFHTDFRHDLILLPLGISFYTFQQISYLVDTYKGETADYSFWEYAAFVSFFPQLVAGPIVLHGEIIPQFRNYEATGREKFMEKGIYAFSVGLAKKVLLADVLGRAVSWGWTNIDYLTGIEVVIIVLAYTFQIYFDFSGYCDMAYGIAQMFYIELPINFNSPYKALSIIDFWKRWHITLTRFLRNYVYFPLGGSRKGTIRTYINVLIVFVLSGIWHGANWTFILWGSVHGLAYCLTKCLYKWWDKLWKPIKWTITFGIVNVGWLIFRSDSVKQAYYVFRKMLNWTGGYKINSELLQSFETSGMEFIREMFSCVPACTSMITIIIVSFLICLLGRNIYEKEYSTNRVKVIIVPILLAWSIVSLSGISTFLYFNF